MLAVNMNHFYYFYEIAKRGSFTETARELMVSQSALSIQMKSFEEALGLTLFNRHKGGVSLTESGETAFSTAEKIFLEMEILLASLKEAKQSVKGVVNIATVNSIGIYVLPDLLKNFKEIFPDVKITIDFKHAGEVIEMVRAGKVDIAMITWFKRYSDLDAVALRKNKLFLLAAPDHPLASKERVPPRELENYPFLAYESGTPTRMMIDALFKRMSLEIEYAMESSNVATIKHMVMAGMGLAFLPEVAVGLEIRQGLIKRIAIPSMAMNQETALYTKSNRTLSSTARAFVDFIKEKLGPRRPESGRGRNGRP